MNSYANTFLPDVLLPLFLCATNIVISRYFHFWLKLGLFMLPCHTPPVAFLLFLSFFVRLGFSFFFAAGTHLFAQVSGAQEGTDLYHVFS